jgi:hypothetical protein
MNTTSTQANYTAQITVPEPPADAGPLFDLRSMNESAIAHLSRGMLLFQTLLAQTEDRGCTVDDVEWAQVAKHLRDALYTAAATRTVIDQEEAKLATRGIQ